MVIKVVYGLAELVVIVILISVVASGTYLPRRYWKAWDPNYHKEFSDPRLQAVAHGLLAASSHNMQPWKVELDKGDPLRFRLFVDSDRLTPQVEPLARQITVSQGTFLEHLRLRAAKTGYQAEISLFPNSEYDEGPRPPV
ncbi:MAG: hypothetical protein PWQ18_473 [Clostridia bacterium]|nr:hypothetical protein [Clostridia bacterium]